MKLIKNLKKVMDELDKADARKCPICGVTMLYHNPNKLKVCEAMMKFRDIEK